MQATLQSLHTVPGVIGGLLSDDDGNVLAHSFPPVFDLPALQGVCSNLNFNLHGLLEATGGVKLLDLRFDHGRVIVRSLQSQVLLLLCEQSVNLQLLTISVNVAIRKIEKLLDQGFKPAFAPPAQTAASVRPIVSATSVPTSIRTDEKGVILTVEILKKTASTFWDSMTESASIGRNTALDISNHFNMGPFKHLTVYNKANGKSARVPVQVIQYDKDGSYNGKIVVTLSLAEQLKVKDGEQLVVEATKGGGVLGWEGI